MCWHELHDTLVISEISLMVRRSARRAWQTFPTFFVSSARGRAAATQLVFNRHFTSFEMIQPLVVPPPGAAAQSGSWPPHS